MGKWTKPLFYLPCPLLLRRRLHPARDLTKGTKSLIVSILWPPLLVNPRKKGGNNTCPRIMTKVETLQQGRAQKRTGRGYRGKRRKKVDLANQPAKEEDILFHCGHPIPLFHPSSYLPSPTTVVTTAVTGGCPPKEGGRAIG